MTLYFSHLIWTQFYLDNTPLIFFIIILANQHVTQSQSDIFTGVCFWEIQHRGSTLCWKKKIHHEVQPKICSTCTVHSLTQLPPSFDMLQYSWCDMTWAFWLWLMLALLNSCFFVGVLFRWICRFAVVPLLDATADKPELHSICGISYLSNALFFSGHVFLSAHLSSFHDDFATYTSSF